MRQKAHNLYDAAFGCLLGACVGEAAGARLEFIGRKPTLDDLRHAMTMPGDLVTENDRAR
jgi:ADP-ribosyl-[dinitrogen reductase] hydrolase